MKEIRLNSWHSLLLVSPVTLRIPAANRSIDPYYINRRWFSLSEGVGSSDIKWGVLEMTLALFQLSLLISLTLS